MANEFTRSANSVNVNVKLAPRGNWLFDVEAESTALTLFDLNIEEAEGMMTALRMAIEETRRRDAD